MILGIDASRCAAANGTGVEGYSAAIIRHLLTLIHEQPHGVFDRVILYTPQEISESVLGGRYAFVEQRVITLPRMWTQLRLSAEMVQEPPDVLFVPSHVLPLVHPAKSVVTIHDVAFMDFPSAYPLSRRLYLRFSTWLAVREATGIIVPSEAVAADLVRHFSCPREKITVVHHGFEAARVDSYDDEAHPSDDQILSNFGINSKMPYIFYVGRLEEKKNIARLVEAFLEFRETHPDWRLILAGGRGFGFERIFDIVERSDAWSDVVMPGYVTNEEREILYRHCRFSAFVSLAEGFGFPILESMSHGKDVLMSDLSVMREIAGKSYGGEFVQPLEIESIAKGLSRLAAKSEQNDLAPKLRVIASSYHWERSAKETLATLSRAVSS